MNPQFERDFNFIFGDTRTIAIADKTAQLEDEVARLRREALIAEARAVRALRAANERITRAIAALTLAKDTAPVAHWSRTESWIDRGLIELGIDPDELDLAHECVEAERNALLASEAETEGAHRREWIRTEEH